MTAVRSVMRERFIFRLRVLIVAVNGADEVISCGCCGVFGECSWSQDEVDLKGLPAWQLGSCMWEG